MSNELEQRSDEWVVKRLGFLGCSRLGDVLAEGRNGQPSSTRRNYMHELMCERLTGESTPHITTKEMQWGIDNEPRAKALYEVKHETFLTETGGKEHATIPWWWGSPDGIDGEAGGVEVKCLNTANHLEVLFSKKINTHYLYQITGYVIIFEREWYRYVGYDPRLPENVRYYEFMFYRRDLPIQRVTDGAVRFLDELNDLVDKVKTYGVEPQDIKKIEG
jgi:hypothetical protein